MNRRNFTQLAGLTGLGMLSTTSALGAQKSAAKYNFNLAYAPHLGMFRNHVGNDPIDQLNFMADQGFTAFEDNDMRNREVALQEKMAQTMAKRGLRMGVFVAHQIYWQKPNLASGDQALREEFLDYIKKAIPVAKRSKREMDDCGSWPCRFATKHGVSDGSCG